MIRNKQRQNSMVTAINKITISTKTKSQQRGFDKCLIINICYQKILPLFLFCSTNGLPGGKLTIKHTWAWPRRQDI